MNWNTVEPVRGAWPRALPHPLVAFPFARSALFTWRKRSYLAAAIPAAIAIGAIGVIDPIAGLAAWQREAAEYG